MLRMEIALVLVLGFVAYMYDSAERTINTTPAARKYKPITNTKYFFESSFMVNFSFVKKHAKVLFFDENRNNGKRVVSNKTNSLGFRTSDCWGFFRNFAAS